MKSLFLVAVSALALSTGACAPTPKPRVALDCPAQQGELTRTAQGADGRTCTYRTKGGADVTLQLVAVKDGDAIGALKAIQTAITPVAAAGAAEDAADIAQDAAEAAKDKAESAKDAAEAAKDAAEDAKASAEQAETDAKAAGARVDIEIDNHGQTIVSKHVGKNGGTSHVDLPGLHITADDDDANVQIGGMHINANGDQATVQIFREVRLRGQAFSRVKRGIRATYISKVKAPGAAYRFVGYEAAGPKTGPLTVAIMRAKDDVDEDDDAYGAIKRLVRRNGGA